MALERVNIPVERPTPFYFVINMKTAKALGLTVSSATRLRADRVIEYDSGDWNSCPARGCRSASDRLQVQLMRSTEPDCTVSMVTQFIVRIGMHEHVECPVVER